MTKEQLGDEIQKLVDRSGLSVEVETKVFEDGEIHGKAFHSKRLESPRFIIYPPGATDETRDACDKLINQTWGR